jgi:hypothetical protein
MPDGLILHFTRIAMTDQHEAPLDQLAPRIQAAAEMLAEFLAETGAEGSRSNLWTTKEPKICLSALVRHTSAPRRSWRK